MLSRAAETRYYKERLQPLIDDVNIKPVGELADGSKGDRVTGNTSRASAASARVPGRGFETRVRLAYLDRDDDGPRSYAATAWVVKGRVPQAENGR